MTQPENVAGITPPPYSKATDPFRVDEQRARARLDQEAAERGFDGGSEFRLLDSFRFTPGGNGEYASFSVICTRSAEDAPFGLERAYSVHTAVLISDSDGVKGARLTDGTYDLTLAEASERVRR